MRRSFLLSLLLLLPSVALADTYDAYQTGYNDGANDVYTLSWHRSFNDQSAYIGGYNDGQEEVEEDNEEFNLQMQDDEKQTHRPFDTIGSSNYTRPSFDYTNPSYEYVN